MYGQGGQQQHQYNLYGSQGSFAGTPYQPVQGYGFGQFGMAQYMHNTPQNSMTGNMNFNQGGSFGMQTNQGMGYQQFSNQQQQPKQTSGQINLSLNSVNQSNKPKKDDDDFGSF